MSKGSAIMIFEKKNVCLLQFLKKVNSMWCIKNSIHQDMILYVSLSPTFREYLCDLRTSRDKCLVCFLRATAEQEKMLCARPRCQALVLYYRGKIPKNYLWLELQVTISDYVMNVNVLQVNTTMAFKFLPFVSCSPTYSHRNSEGNFQNK